MGHGGPYAERGGALVVDRVLPQCPDSMCIMPGSEAGPLRLPFGLSVRVVGVPDLEAVWSPETDCHYVNKSNLIADP